MLISTRSSLTSVETLKYRCHIFHEIMKAKGFQSSKCVKKIEQQKRLVKYLFKF